MMRPCLSISTSMSPASIRREKALVLALLIGSAASFCAKACHSLSVYRKRELSNPLVTTAPRLSELRYLTGMDSVPFSSTVSEYSPINIFFEFIHFSPLLSTKTPFLPHCIPPLTFRQSGQLHKKA